MWNRVARRNVRSTQGSLKFTTVCTYDVRSQIKSAEGYDPHLKSLRSSRMLPVLRERLLLPPAIGCKLPIPAENTTGLALLQILIDQEAPQLGTLDDAIQLLDPPAERLEVQRHSPQATEQRHAPPPATGGTRRYLLPCIAACTPAIVQLHHLRHQGPLLLPSAAA